METGLTNNITHAFEVYQAVLAEQERDIFIETMVSGNRPPTQFDKYERPKCPECGADLLFRPVSDNPEGIKVQLVCTNQECDLVLNSEISIEEWEKELRRGSEQTKEE